jgi:hypothetical protein
LLFVSDIVTVIGDMARFAVLTLLAAVVDAQTYGCNISQVQPPGTWYTKADENGVFRFYNTAKGSQPQVLRGISMTGFETGT